MTITKIMLGTIAVTLAIGAAGLITTGTPAARAAVMAYADYRYKHVTAALDVFMHDIHDIASPPEARTDPADGGGEAGALLEAGTVAVMLGDATKFSMNAWTPGLDLTIGTRSTDRAERLASVLCHGWFGDAIRPGHYKVRVYLIDCSEAAECRIG